MTNGAAHAAPSSCMFARGRSSHAVDQIGNDFRYTLDGVACLLDDRLGNTLGACNRRLLL